jgi:hypothetical protein
MHTGKKYSLTVSTASYLNNNRLKFVTHVINNTANGNQL